MATPNSRKARDTSIRAVAQTIGRPASGGTSTTSVRPSIRAHFSGSRQSRPRSGSASADIARTTASAATSASTPFFIAGYRTMTMNGEERRTIRPLSQAIFFSRTPPFA